MAVTYTTAQKVANQARLLDPTTGARLTLSTGTDPTLAEVEDIINQIEDEVDNECNHAWREKTVTDELHDFMPGPTGYYSREYNMPLSHRKVKTFAHASGDKLELFTSAGWINLIDPANGYTEDRLNGAYWVDYQNGMVMLKPGVARPTVSGKAIRVTYRYGETVIPKDIERAVTLMAAAHVVRTDYYKVAIPQGEPFVNVRESIAAGFEKEAAKILSNHHEIGRTGF